MTRRILFSLLLLWSALCAAQNTFTGVARIVAIGDVHGDYKQLTQVLRDAGVINEKNKWIGGKTFFVQTGDLVDRGPDSRKVMDLIMDLEKQAPKAGGKVIPLLGNHETMNIIGDLRYVTPEEIAAFATSESETIRQAYVEKQIPADEQKQWLAEHPPGWLEMRVAFGPNGKYGKWLRGNRAAVKVNDILFVHGGISDRYSDLTIDQINEYVSKELTDPDELKGGLVMDNQGPLWFRGLANAPESQIGAHVDLLLKTYGVKHIAVGHTPTVGAIMPRFGGKVILIDVGLSRVYGGPPDALIVENGSFQALHRGKTFPLPMTKEGVLAYLKELAATDPQPSPLEKVIKNTSAPVTVSDQ